MSLQVSAVTSDDLHDPAWVGTCSFPRNEGVNGIAVEEWRKARRVRDIPVEKDYYYLQGISHHSRIISDVRQDQDLQTLTFFKNAPWARFFVSVPLRGGDGSVIGALNILDDRPRYGVSASDMAFLEDISDTVVEHLNATITRAQRQRGERHIQALGLFNRGKSSLRDWWRGQEDVRARGAGRHAAKQGSEERQARVDAEFGMQTTASGDYMDLDGEAKDDSPPDNGGYFSAKSMSVVQRLKYSNAPSQAASKPPVPDGVVRPGGVNRTGTKKEDGVFNLGNSIEDAYARATNLLREAMGACGVVILNANKVQGNLGRKTSEHADDGANTPQHMQTSDSDTADSSPERSNLCNILGFSTRTKSSLGGFAPETQRFHISNANLQRLVERYPNGLVIHFDDQGRGHISSDEDSEVSSNEDRDIEAQKRHKDGKILSKAIKGARTVALLPLWDDSRERWRSTIFAWTTSPDNYFDRSEHLTYLTAFGHSLLAELSRLESLADERAKATFISSISHELRSPLHGILAGVEFLQESDMTSFQEEMAHTISMAGRMLLDTVNHILDYSKISSHSRAQKTDDKAITKLGRSNSEHPRDMANSTVAECTIDLARLTEEVVETTVAAHRSLCTAPQSPHTPQATTRPPLKHGSSTTTSISMQLSDVAVTLNIDYRKNWVAVLEPGGWTRVLSNVLGNALKYTTSGHISVRLIAGKPDEDKQRAPIQLIIEDTGVGISTEFQSSGLFTPFKQQDSHSPGTGLGLSIVKQIALEMGANLDLKSQQGKGTMVTLSLFVSFATGESMKDLAFTEDSKPEHLAVDHFHLLAPGMDEDDDENAIGHEVGDSVLDLASQWLRCTTTHGSNVELATGNSVCAITEAQLTELELTSPAVLMHLLAEAAKTHSHMLVLGASVRSLSLASDNMPSTLVPIFIHQPIGPRKLLRAIASDRNSTSQIDDKPRSATSIANESFGATKRRPMLSSANSTSRVHQSSRLSSSIGANPSILGSLLESSRNSTAEEPLTAGDTSVPSSVTSAEAATPSQHSTSTQPPAIPDTVLLVEDNEINMKVRFPLLCS